MAPRLTDRTARPIRAPYPTRRGRLRPCSRPLAEIRFEFHFRQQGELVYYGDPTAMFMKEPALS
jgi:hypothetical protein